MKLSKLVGDRFKERPANCQIDSHALMVRGGYIKNVANGIYSQFPPMKRISQKIEAIIRDETMRSIRLMDRKFYSLLHYRVVFGKNQEDMKV